MRMLWRTLSFALVPAIALVTSAHSQSLSFQPQRVVLSGRANTESMTLTNSGKQEATYRVELLELIYKDDGSASFATFAPSGFPSARPFVRFSPSQVRLAPGESQKVNILVRTPAELAAGEYRIHARFAQIPSAVEAKGGGGKTVAGVVGLSEAIAIPVIIRRGQTSAQGSISSIKVVSDKLASLDLKLSRTGNASLYTNLILKDQAGKVAAEVKGVALPVPNAFRRYFFPLGKLSPGALGGHTLEMVDHDTGAVIDKKPVK